MKRISLTYNPRLTNCPVTLPLSKSVALRALTLTAVMGALGKPAPEIAELPDAGDVSGMLRALKLYYKQIADVETSGLNGESRLDTLSEYGSYPRVDIGQGGAPLRFFLALAASTPGVRLILDCEDSLKSRPHSILVNALRAAGADIMGEGPDGALPPYRITGRYLSMKRLEVPADVSSQYISALMMAAPLWDGGLDLTLVGGRIVSMPYIKMTAALLDIFGIEVRIHDNDIRVFSEPKAGSTPLKELKIPEDWSAVSYFYELAAIKGGNVAIESLAIPNESLQGDSALEKIFNNFGVSTRYFGSEHVWLSGRPGIILPDDMTYDFTDTPDIVPAIVVAACLLGVAFRFTGVGHLRHKETDRMAALIAEMEKLGYILEGGAETLSWNGKRCLPMRYPEIATYNDHRMAMAFAPAAVRFPGLRIKNPEVVNKSFSGFWEQLALCGFEIEIEETC